MAVVTICSDFGARENKVCYYFHFFPIYLTWSDGIGTIILFLWMLSFKPVYSLSSLTFIKRFFSSSSLSALRVVLYAYLRLLLFLLASWFQLVLHPAQLFTWCTLHIRQISSVTVYHLGILLSQFWTSPLFHVWFWLLLLSLHTGFSWGR